MNCIVQYYNMCYTILKKNVLYVYYNMYNTVQYVLYMNFSRDITKLQYYYSTCYIVHGIVHNIMYNTVYYITYNIITI